MELSDGYSHTRSSWSSSKHTFTWKQKLLLLHVHFITPHLSTITRFIQFKFHTQTCSMEKVRGWGSGEGGHMSGYAFLHVQKGRLYLRLCEGWAGEPHSSRVWNVFTANQSYSRGVELRALLWNGQIMLKRRRLIPPPWTRLNRANTAWDWATGRKPETEGETGSFTLPPVLVFFSFELCFPNQPTFGNWSVSREHRTLAKKRLISPSNPNSCLILESPMDHFRFIEQENEDKTETGANKMTHVLCSDWEAGVTPWGGQRIHQVITTVVKESSCLGTELWSCYSLISVCKMKPSLPFCCRLLQSSL